MPLPLQPKPIITAELMREFRRALSGGRGALDSWLEVNNEEEVRAHILTLIAEERSEAYSDGRGDAQYEYDNR